MKSFFFLTTLIWTSLSWAQFDFKYGGALRTFPFVGGAAEINTGYSFKLWGDPNTLLYGLIRPSLKANSSVVVSDQDASVFFYPISFIGLGVGHKKMISEYTEFQNYDCTKVRCQGELNKDYAAAKIAFEWGSWLATHSYTEFRNSYSDETAQLQPVAEYQWTSAVNPLREKSQRKTYFLGYKLNGDYLGLAADYRAYQFSQQFFKLKVFVYQYNQDNIAITFGLGSQESAETGAGTVFVLRFAHTLKSSLALF